MTIQHLTLASPFHKLHGLLHSIYLLQLDNDVVIDVAHSDAGGHVLHGTAATCCRHVAGCGENLFMSTAPKSWSNVIQSFYDEGEGSKYGLGGIQPNVKFGQYTQLVWATPCEIGCAVDSCPPAAFRYIYVCHCCPGGNNVGTMMTPYKARKPCGDCPDHCDNGLCTNPCMYANKYTNCADLVENLGCDAHMTKGNCQATCKCASKIK
ncbi:cysteine-rich venom protein Cau1-like [Nycticebus coucang]|uniref:cysteine-rich venom protein Cau1-like n=1 Tax=Nycticebus coucang TaxID=9470 RepID=UPI00234D592E|nr:cysteine-rich venom protein Cau1-like [Nycticebus coucang]